MSAIVILLLLYYILILFLLFIIIILLLLFITIFFYTNYYMTIKQYIQNKDVKLGLFDWAWATKDTEKYRIYNALLDNFLSDKDVAKLKFRPKILFIWHLYCGALQDYTLNGKNEKLNDIIKRCPLSVRERKTLFG